MGSKTGTVQVKLTLPELMAKKLKEEMERFAYHNIQEVILDAVRDKYFREKPSGETKRGRPRKLDLLKIASAKKVFK